MLEKPDLPAEKIHAALLAEYGLHVLQVDFLPLGADQNTAVYRAAAEDETPYFVKLRQGDFDETALTLPKFLCDQGIKQIIPPLRTMTGQLWTSLDEYRVILYPYVDGQNGYEVELSKRNWYDLGTALKLVHHIAVPPALASRIPRETYPPDGRESVKMFLERVEADSFADRVAGKVAELLKNKRDVILDLLDRAGRLALTLQDRSPEYVVCHSDIHAGNVLIDARDRLYIVDWDNPILAPKERDLMFIGGAQGFRGHTAQEEEILFYRGYGRTEINPYALAYYRYERIVQDIAVFCGQLLLTDDGGEDREQSLRYLASNFMPNNTIEIAYRSDKT